MGKVLNFSFRLQDHSPILPPGTSGGRELYAERPEKAKCILPLSH